jgi:hypothetical protein
VGAVDAAFVVITLSSQIGLICAVERLPTWNPDILFG